MTREVPQFPRTTYPVPARRMDKEIRAFADEALAQSQAKKPLIDVRSPGEFKGEITHMAEYPQEGVLRGGHIPGREKRAVENRDKRRQHLQIRAPSWRRFTSTSAGSNRTSTRSFIAASANARATPGLCSPICSGSITCAITMVPGRSGATKSAPRSNVRQEVRLPA